MTDETPGADLAPEGEPACAPEPQPSVSGDTMDGSASVTAASRPDGLPDKFWDPEAETVRISDLVKSYCELEARFSQDRASGSQLETTDQDRPQADYDIALDEGLIHVDPEVNAQLQAAGFSNEQAQLVYDMANTYFGELAARLKTEVMLNHQASILEQHYGGPDRWNQVQDQIKTWAEKNLPPSLVDSLAYSAEGVLVLQQLMAGQEPSILAGMSAGDIGLTEEKLRERMQDPRYWRDHDPVLVREIQDGFERLYPSD